MHLDVFRILDILGTIAFAASGALAAMHKRLDLFGVLIIAFVTAIGGGTVRDVLIGATPVSWIRDISYTLIILAVAFIVMPLNHVVGNYKKTLMFFDAIGLGLFTLTGIQKGLAFSLHPGICVALGTVTACFGGIIRDTLLNNIPLIFRKEIYASACIVGGSLYVFLRYLHFDPIFSEVLCIVIIVLIRVLAVRYQWKLPKLYK